MNNIGVYKMRAEKTERILCGGLLVGVLIF